MIDIYPPQQSNPRIQFKALIVKILLIIWLIYFSFPITNVDEIQLQASLLGLFGN